MKKRHQTHLKQHKKIGDSVVHILVKPISIWRNTRSYILDADQ